MTRSVKKGPFCDAHLIKKVDVAVANKDKKPIHKNKNKPEKPKKEAKKLK